MISCASSIGLLVLNRICIDLDTLDLGSASKRSAFCRSMALRRSCCICAMIYVACLPISIVYRSITMKSAHESDVVRSKYKRCSMSTPRTTVNQLICIKGILLRKKGKNEYEGLLKEGIHIYFVWL